MSIIVGKENPVILGGIDSINKPQCEAVVDALQQSEELKNINEVKVQAPVEESKVEEPVEVVKKPRRGRKSKKECES